MRHVSDRRRSTAGRGAAAALPVAVNGSVGVPRPAGDSAGPGAVVGALVVSSPGLVRALLLNASHEPLSVVPGRRAVVLVVAGKAECVLERSGPMLHSPSAQMAVPAVVRLRRYVRVPFQPPPAVTRAGVLRRDGRRCAYCGGRGETVDHVVPRSRGGDHSWENCVACCLRCNTRKADRLLSELGWSLRVPPTVPRRGPLGAMFAADEADPVWEPWLGAVA